MPVSRKSIAEIRAGDARDRARHRLSQSSWGELPLKSAVADSLFELWIRANAGAKRRSRRSCEIGGNGDGAVRAEARDRRQEDSDPQREARSAVLSPLPYPPFPFARIAQPPIQ